MALKIRLSYGRSGLQILLPEEHTTVIEPRFDPALPDQVGALRAGLHRPIGSDPLRKLVRGAAQVAISVCDATRAIPTRKILPPLLSELSDIDPSRIRILVATGTHRGSTEAELDRMLGPEIRARYQVIDHDCRREDNLVSLGTTNRGIPIWLNRHWVESDTRITVGFVEPHFFAGFSGGPKMVAPGLAGLDTVMALHSAEILADPHACFGEIERNPVHREIREIARICGVTFALDVSINRDREITGVFAGKLAEAHAEACRFVRSTSMQPVSEPFDVVVTTNSGYPLDLNLYQSVKGMSAAARVVRQDGTIVCASECSDGIPDHGCYGEILASCKSPREVLDLVMSPGYSRPDQWQAQLQAQIQLKARVFVKSDGLSEEEIHRALFEPVEDIEGLVERRIREIGPSARVCVLPEGPQTIPYLSRSQ